MKIADNISSKCRKRALQDLTFNSFQMHRIWQHESLHREKSFGMRLRAIFLKQCFVGYRGFSKNSIAVRILVFHRQKQSFLILNQPQCSKTAKTACTRT
jgi:hypothetical protein